MTTDHSLRGPIDRGALTDFRDEFTRLEPLASATLDDPVDPSVLRLTYDDGIGDASSGRFDVAWSVRDDYSVHYTDGVRDFRWDVHDNDYPNAPGDPHFHPPPDASSDPDDVEDSCIEVGEIVLVARAVVDRWRAAYADGSAARVNDATNPP